MMRIESCLDLVEHLRVEEFESCEPHSLPLSLKFPWRQQ